MPDPSVLTWTAVLRFTFGAGFVMTAGLGWTWFWARRLDRHAVDRRSLGYALSTYLTIALEGS
jgi:hypothetical protein